MNLRKNAHINIIFIIALWLLIFQPLPGHAQKSGDEVAGSMAKTDVIKAAGIENVASNGGAFHLAAELKAEPEGPENSILMSLQDFIQLVVKKNESILSQQLNYRISQEAIRSEQSEFEPQLLTSYQQGREKAKLSPREQLSFLTSGASERDEINTTYNTAIESKVPTGATVRMGYTLQSSQDIILKEKELYTSFLGVEITQPLLKGAGMAATAKIDIAEADSDVAFQSYRQKMLEVVLNAAGSCWDFYQARETLKIRKDSVKIAEQILKDNRERAKLGKMADTEVMEAEAGLVKRKSLERGAKQDLLAAINTMRSYISSSTVDIEIAIDFMDEINFRDFTPDFKSSIKKAFYYRPEYLSAKRKIEREDIVVSYTTNQLWPQLDLTGSYGLNGLEDSPGNSWNDMFDGDYTSWTVGAVLSIPLKGGMKMKSELASAKDRRRQALLELKSVEVEVANMVHTAIQNVYSTIEQVQYYKDVSNLNRRLLEIEMAMLEAGRSNSRSVLDKEEDLIEAREAELKSFIDNRKAILILEMTEGSLLTKYGVEILEEKKEKFIRQASDKSGRGIWR